MIQMRKGVSMKKRNVMWKSVFIGVIGVLGLLLIFSFVGRKQQQEKLRQWSAIVAQTAQKMETDEKTEVYAKGKTVTIPLLDYEQMVEYYKLNNLKEDEAKQEAEIYVKERYAIYAEAIEQGYTAAEEDINEYLEALKTEMSDEKNKKTAEIIEETFGTKEAYWEYERELAKVDLPIKQYINAVAKQYKEENEKASQKEWNKRFDSMKNDLVKKQEFKVMINN